MRSITTSSEFLVANGLLDHIAGLSVMVYLLSIAEDGKAITKLSYIMGNTGLSQKATRTAIKVLKKKNIIYLDEGFASKLGLKIHIPFLEGHRNGTETEEKGHRKNSVSEAKLCGQPLNRGTERAQKPKKKGTETAEMAIFTKKEEEKERSKEKEGERKRSLLVNTHKEHYYLSSYSSSVFLSCQELKSIISEYANFKDYDRKKKGNPIPDLEGWKRGTYERVKNDKDAINYIINFVANRKKRLKCKNNIEVAEESRKEPVKSNPIDDFIEMIYEFATEEDQDFITEYEGKMFMAYPTAKKDNVAAKKIIECGVKEMIKRDFFQESHLKASVLA